MKNPDKKATLCHRQEEEKADLEARQAELEDKNCQLKAQVTSISREISLRIFGPTCKRNETSSLLVVVV